MTFLKNVWYAAGTANELKEAPVSRRICNELVVLMRGADGSVGALQDRCPHRFVPLSAATQCEGNAIRCPYHGLVFDFDGNCIERPFDDGPMQPGLHVRSYPLVERDGMLWIWMGEPDSADPDTIPDFSYISDTDNFRTVFGYLHVNGHYEMIADNLLDLSHVHFLHPTAAPGVSFQEFDNKLELNGTTVWSRLRKPNFRPPEWQSSLWESDSEFADGRADVRWVPPACLNILTALTEVGGSFEDGLQMPSGHFITPETETSSHYFWAISRNVQRDNAMLDEITAENTNSIFSGQDSPIIAAQQAAMGQNTDFLAENPVILKADAAGVAARRVLRRLIAAESAGQFVEVDRLRFGER